MNKTLIAGMVAGLFALPAWAAQVPAGTKLLPDAQQIYVTNIGTEPTTIAPQLVEETAGSAIVNELPPKLMSRMEPTKDLVIYSTPIVV
ncbi:hypothetical protein NBH81_12155 [Aeromonas veronii]|nr:hypothetical protein NBH81_12155 [Aeromonas veronii]